MKKIIVVACAFLSIGCFAQKKGNPYLVVLSMDGFRWDYVDSFPTPNLHYMIKNGVHAKSLIPSFPSITFPNHYSIATGLYPDHHGIVNNSFYDPNLKLTYKYTDSNTNSDGRFYGGEPIWVTAGKQNLKTANYFWPGSEAEIEGIRPTYWKKYNSAITYQQRIDTVLYWLNLPETSRPHLVMFYFDNPDHLTHSIGPSGPEVRKMIMHLDTLIGIFLSKIKQLSIRNDVNFMIVSDHGMEAISNSKVVFLDQYIRKEWCEHMNGHYAFIMTDAKQGFSDSIFTGLMKAPHLKVWHKYDVPGRLHFGLSPNIGEFVILADSAYSITWSGEKLMMGGNHGYDNLNTDMQGIFYAIGPAFKKGYLQPSFENVNLYELMTHVLKITPAKNDGNLNMVEKMLKGR